jgi:hypothetical protein
MSQIVRVCNRALLLDRGRCRAFGDVDAVTRQYDALCEPGSSTDATVYVDRDIEDFRLLLNRDTVSHGEHLQVQLHFRCRRRFDGVHATGLVYDHAGQLAGQWDDTVLFELAEGENTMAIDLGPLHLSAGTYYLTVTVKHHQRAGGLIWSHKVVSFHVQGPLAAYSTHHIPVRVESGI